MARIWPVLLLLSSAVSYNIDELDPIVIKSPVKGINFGYSVSFQSAGDSHWLLVGAPTANVTRSNGTVGVRWGTVYKCTLDQQCIEISLDTAPEAKDEIKSGMWGGGALAYSKVTKSAVTCAHRYQRRGILGKDQIKDELGIRGKCWTISPQGGVKTLPQLCTPLNDTNTDRCSAGLSVTYYEDMLNVGAPGYNMWAGESVFYNTTSNSIADNKGQGNYKICRSSGSDAYINKGCNNKVDSYLGYSSASCYDPKTDAVYYFSGAPRAGTQLTGKVDMVRVSANGKKEAGHLALGMSKILVGANFGFSVTCGTFAKDKMQVVVGAPTFSNNNKDLINNNNYIGSDRGAVFVYQINPLFPQASFAMNGKGIYGERAGDRFGYSMSSIGDVNHDGFDDLAVGAPAELSAGEGVVYIYLGSTKGLQNKYFQKIRSQPLVHGFGAALYGGVDVDNNGFVDMVVGAYRSDQVAVYRSLPIINIIVNHTMPDIIDKGDICKGSGIGNGSDTACFDLKYCINYIAGNSIDHLDNVTFGISVGIALDINMDYSKRVRFQDGNYTYNTSVAIQYGRSTVDCSNVTVYLMELLSSIKEPIAITTSIDNIKSAVFENRTSLNATQPILYMSYVKIKTECGEAECLTDLILTSTLQFDFDQLEGGAPNHTVIYAGYNKLLTANITTQRNGTLGRPYGAHLEIQTPNTVVIESVRNNEGLSLGLCTSYGNVGSYYCELDDRLDRNSSFNFTIEFSVFGLKGEEREMQINIELKSDGGDEQNQTDNQVIHTVPVRKLAKIQLNGTAAPSAGSFQIEKDPPPFGRNVEEVGKEQLFSFLISNMGPSHVQNFRLVMEVPAFLNNTLDQDFLYPFTVESNSEIVCEQQNLNIKHLVSQSKRRRRDIKAHFSPYEDLGQSILQYYAGGNTSWTPYLCGGLADCVTITCTVLDVKERQLTALRLRTYIWSRTFTEAVNISTAVRGWLFNMDESVDLTTTTFLGPITIPTKIMAVEQVRKTVNIWIIIGSVTGGLVLLAVCILILYKMGFFKRKRPDKSEFYREKAARGDTEPVINVHESFCESEDEDEGDLGNMAFHNPLADDE